MKLLVAKRVLKNYAKGLRCPKERLSHAIRRCKRRVREQEKNRLLLQYVLDEFGQPLSLPRTPMWLWVSVWGRFFDEGRRFLLQEEVAGVSVSTIFLGLDHSFSLVGDALLWETGVKHPGRRWDIVARYASRSDALMGHARALAAVLSTSSESAEAS